MYYLYHFLKNDIIDFYTFKGAHPPLPTAFGYYLFQQSLEVNLL